MGFIDGGYLGTPPAVVTTPEGGIAVRYINKTGAASIKGTLVAVSTAVSMAVANQSSEFDTIGAIYENGIADGSPVLVVVSGIAQVLLKDATASTMGNLLIAADTDGRANATTAAPSSGLPSVDTHFKECGHMMQTVVGGTNVLAYASIHFN